MRAPPQVKPFQHRIPPDGRQVSRNVLHCYSTQKIEEAAVVTADHEVRCLPVLDQDEEIVGVVSLDDIAENFSEHIAGETLGKIVEER